MLLSGPDNPKICLFPLEDLDPHLIHGSLCPRGSPFQTASQSFHSLCKAHEYGQQTQTTLLSTHVCSSRPHLAIAAMQPNNNNSSDGGGVGRRPRRREPPPFPQKLPLSLGISAPLSNTWFLRPTLVTVPNGMWIWSAVFAWLTIIPTAWPTERVTYQPRYSMCSSRLLSLDVMQFNNNGICRELWGP